MHIYTLLTKKGEYPFIFFSKKRGVPLFFEKNFSIDSNRVQCTESEKLYPIEKFNSNAEIIGFQGFQKKKGSTPFFRKKNFDRF